MIRARSRVLVLLCIAVFGAGQPVLSAAPLASALTWLFHAADHAHALAYVEDDGHVDVVLSHDPRDEPAVDAGARAGEARITEPGHAHVLHLDDTNDVAGRRTCADPAPPLATIVSIPAPSLAPPTPSAVRAACTPGARPPGAVVLRC